jgi:head-tail adaptor
MAAPSIGALREWLVIQRSDAAALSVTSLTRSSTTATATTATPHGYTTGDYVTTAGASPAGYNGKVQIAVTGPTTFTYSVVNSLTTPATGTITAVYVSDALGGRKETWRTLDTVPAELIPIRAWERLQATAVQSGVDYRFRVRARSDVTAAMRLLWTPSWPQGSARQTLEITGPTQPDPTDRAFMFIEAGARP